MHGLKGASIEAFEVHTPVLPYEYAYNSLLQAVVNIHLGFGPTIPRELLEYTTIPLDKASCVSPGMRVVLYISTCICMYINNNTSRFFSLDF